MGKRHIFLIQMIFWFLLGSFFVCSAGEPKFHYGPKAKTPWDGMTRFSEDNDFVKLGKDGVLVAGPVTEKIMVPQSWEKYVVAGEPLLFKEKSSGKTFLNSFFFTDLQRYDATRRLEGERKIGTFKEWSFSGISPRDLVFFLLDWRVIKTYRDFESRLRISRESETETSYEAVIEGDHHWVTMIDYWEPLVFSIRIEKKTGELFYTCLAHEPCPAKNCLGVCHRGL